MIERTTIGDCVDTCDSWNPAAGNPDGEFYYIDIASIDRTEKRIVDVVAIPRKDAPSRARQIVKENDVLVSTVRPNLNAVAVVPASLDGATASTGFTVLRPRVGRIEAAYLFHWVRTPQFVDQMIKQATGASYPAVSDKIVRNAELPLPSTDEQRRIAAILDKADALRVKRREAIAKLDQLLQSVFLDMFGEPVRVEKRWPMRMLKEVARVQTGGTPPSDVLDAFDGPVPFVTPGDLGGTITGSRRTVTAHGARLSRTAPAGSTLVCCIGATIGKMGLTTSEVAFNQQINAVTWQSDVEPRYGYLAMRFLSEDIARRGTSTTLPILKKSAFEELMVTVPDRPTQDRFGLIFSSIESDKVKMLDGLLHSHRLLRSLQSSIFSGST